MLMAAAKASPAPRDFIGAIKSAGERTGKPGLIAEVGRWGCSWDLQTGAARMRQPRARVVAALGAA